MVIPKTLLSTLCLGWAFALLLGLTVGLNVPFILMLAWSILLALA